MPTFTVIYEADGVMRLGQTTADSGAAAGRRYARRGEVHAVIAGHHQDCSDATAAPASDMDTIVGSIAREHLGFSTLEPRRSDSLDFRDCACWCVRAALEAAYEAGRAAATGS